MKTMRDRDDPRQGQMPEQPRAEPEIIPPGERGGISETPSRIWVRLDGEERTYRAYISRPGPFSIIFALIVVGLIAAVILVLLAGVVLVWIPIVIALVAAAFLSGSIRNRWRRWRGG